MSENKDKVDLNNPDFHDKLEEALEPNLRSEKKEVEKPAKEVSDENKSEKKETVEEDWKKKFEDLASEKTNLEKRYEGSSKEAKRLKEENEKLLPYAPLLHEIGQDPDLRKKIEDHVAGKDSEKETVDFDEILTDEEKFKKAVRAEADARIKEVLDADRKRSAEERRRDEIQAERLAFQRDNGFTDEQMNDLDEFAKGTKIGYPQIHAIREYEKSNKDVDSKKQENQTNEILAHLAKTGRLPKTLASLSSTEQDESPDQKLRDIFHSLESSDLEKVL